MRRLIVSEFVTVDGVMQAPGGVDEDTEGGFQHGGWQMAYFDDMFGRHVMGGFAETDALLLGRTTYDIFAAYWPHQPEDDPVAPTMNGLKKYVVSDTLEAAEWANSTVIRGDVPGRIRRLKAEEGKDIRVIGSGTLVQTLANEDLVDQYDLMIHPIILGRGKHLFKEGVRTMELRLVDSQVTSTGVLLLTYVPANRA